MKKRRTNSKKPPTRGRARDFPIPLVGTTGPLNAITDVQGVEVGHVTLIEGEGRLVVGRGPVRTGVTAVLPRGKTYDPVFAAIFSFNGNGEMTGTHWVEESGFLETPVVLTNTHSVGVARDAVVAWQLEHRLYDPLASGHWWSCPVVAETYDGVLNDINGFHVKPQHVHAALNEARSGPVVEGNVGGGTGMICYGFKGGIGTASRVLPGGHTLGALVQANFGRRGLLTIAGVPVGQEIGDLLPEEGSPSSGEKDGSIIVVLAVDAPLLPHQLKRLARRAPLGIARTGGIGANTSGDLIIAFSTANPGAAGRIGSKTLQMLPNDSLDPFLEAAIQATEEAILNALLAAETMVGVNRYKVYNLPNERLGDLLAP